MIKTLRQIIHMKAALWVNAFLYYFKRLWLIGKALPDSFYSDYGLKRAFSVAAVIIRQIIDFFGKPLYLLMFVVLPYMTLAQIHPELKEQGFAFMVQVLFFLNCGLGAFGDSQIFTVTRDKITCVKYMHMNPRTYVQAFLALKYVPFFAYYLLWLLIFSPLLGGSVFEGFILWLMLLTFRLMGEVFHLVIFDHTGKVISRNMLYDWLVIILGLAGAYVPAAAGLSLPLPSVLIHPVSAVIYAAVIGVCLWYIALGYKGYEKKFGRSIDLNFLLTTMLKKSSSNGAGFKEVEIKEKDAAISEDKKEKFRNLKGYSYMNALFFARHRRQLLRPVYYRIIMTAVLFLASLTLLIADRELAVKSSGNLTELLPSFIFIMYFMTVADKASRAMFYNCDKDMLHYAYYREPGTLLKTFRIRLVRVSLYDMTVAGAVCLAAIAFCLLCKTSIFTADMALFCAAILLLSILFTAHHLCLYYIFQPYSESLQVKNPLFSIVNVVMYSICFVCLRINAGGLAFTMAVFVFTIVYITVVLALVYRLAPKTFRVK